MKQPTTGTTPLPERLSARQLQVARLLGEGYTNPCIAAQLGISLDGAKWHVSELLGRLGMESRKDVARWVRAKPRAA